MLTLRMKWPANNNPKRTKTEEKIYFL